MNRTLIAAGALAVIAAGVLWLPAAHRFGLADSAPAATPGDASRAVSFPVPAQPAAPVFVTGLEALPASLAGSDPNDALRVDADGHLVVDLAVRDLFDWFLTTVGEEPADTVAARIRAWLAHRLAEPARGEALALLSDYLAFRADVEALSRRAQQAAEDNAASSLRASLAAIRDLRSRHFSRATDAAFFGEQDAFDDYTLARLELDQQPGLGPEERAQRLGRLLERLPGSAREGARLSAVMQSLGDLDEACRRAPCRDDALHRARAALVGEAAAERLAQLDRDEAALQARLAGYFLQRDRILSSAAFGEADRQAQLAALQRELFSPEEQLRLAALERIHDAGAASSVN